MFDQHVLNLGEANYFETLSNSFYYSSEFVGRRGGILVKCDVDKSVPIIRTTTPYTQGPCVFDQVHMNIIKQIHNIHNIDDTYSDNQMQFNNAMIEHYTKEYRKMKFHTDQSLDLEDESVICLFSCYKNPSTTNTRTLVVRNKKSGETQRHILHHNSVILFTTKTNKEHVHKIVLEQTKLKSKINENLDAEWIGITFRVSKTFVTPSTTNSPCYFITRDNGNIKESENRILRLATEQERVEFLKLKGCENIEQDFVYPKLDYTLSPSDLMPVRDYTNK